MKIIPPIRTQDNHGAGHYGASRGSRTHNGIDYACYPGSQVLCLHGGEVTKLGYPYGDDLSYRYVQVTDEKRRDWRYFYVDAAVKMGQFVYKDSSLGTVQSLDKRYPGITEHVHLEIKQGDEYLDPESTE